MGVMPLPPAIMMTQLGLMAMRFQESVVPLTYNNMAVCVSLSNGVRQQQQQHNMIAAP